jgi:hypothetical protein
MSEAERQFNAQLRLERDFLIRLGNFNSALTRKFVRDYGLRSDILRATDFEDQLDEILLDHYRKVGDKFDSTIKLPKSVEKTEEESNEIAAALAGLYLLRSKEQGAIITDTNQKNINESVAQSQEQSRIEAGKGNLLSQMETATIAGVFLSRKLKGRTPTIAQTETQFIAETAKSTEMNILIGQKPDFQQTTPRPSGVSKTWFTMGDEIVRKTPFNHVNADGQTVDANDVFRVSNESLMFPGDMSQGASLGNIINCRCKSIPSTVDIANIRRENARITIVS